MDVQVHSIMTNIPISNKKMDMVRKSIAFDFQMQSLKQTILDGWSENRTDSPTHLLGYWNYRDELSYTDGILLKCNKVIIPKGLRQIMLEKIYDSHFGVKMHISC